jgi:hypothetical protein
MRAFFVVAVMALLVGVPVAGAAAHHGWFVRVCQAKTEADRIHLAFRRRAGIQLVLDQGPDPQ